MSYSCLANGFGFLLANSLYKLTHFYSSMYHMDESCIHDCSLLVMPWHLPSRVATWLLSDSAFSLSLFLF